MFENGRENEGNGAIFLFVSDEIHSQHVVTAQECELLGTTITLLKNILASLKFTSLIFIFALNKQYITSKISHLSLSCFLGTYFDVHVFRPHVSSIQMEMVTVESLHAFLGNKTEYLNN